MQVHKSFSFDEVLQRISADEEKLVPLAIRLLESEQQAAQTSMSKALLLLQDEVGTRGACGMGESKASPESTGVEQKIARFRCHWARFAKCVDFLNTDHMRKQASQAVNAFSKKQKHFTIQVARMKLLSNVSPASSQSKNGTGAASVVDAHITHSHTVTEALRECKATLEQHIEQVDAASETLATDAQSLGRSKATFSEHQKKMQEAAYLLRKIKYKERIDNLIFYGGLCLFFSVAVYVLCKRTGVIWLIAKSISSLTSIFQSSGQSDLSEVSGIESFDLPVSTDVGKSELDLTTLCTEDEQACVTAVGI